MSQQSEVSIERKLELLDAIVRQVVLASPVYQLVRMMVGFGWERGIFGEDDRLYEVMDAAISTYGDVDDFEELMKPHLGEALAKALGAKEVTISWE